MGNWNRMRQWGMTVGVAMIGFAALAYSGQIDPVNTFYASDRWAWPSALASGLMFGFGVVLTSGCGGKPLVRIGGGSLKALAVFFVMGMAAFSTFKGVMALARANTVDQVAVDFVADAALPTWIRAAFGIKTLAAGLALGLLLGSRLIAWAVAGFRHIGENLGNNLLAGLGIGGVIVDLTLDNMMLSRLPTPSSRRR